MGKEDYKVVVHTVLREEPFTWFFGDHDEAKEFFESVKKQGITVMTGAGAAVVTPNAFRAVSFEGLHGVTISPAAAVMRPQASMGGESN